MGLKSDGAIETAISKGARLVCATSAVVTRETRISLRPKKRTASPPLIGGGRKGGQRRRVLTEVRPSGMAAKARRHL